MKPEWQEKIFPGNVEGATISFLDGKLTIDWKSWTQDSLLQWTHHITNLESEHDTLPKLLEIVDKLKKEIEEAICLRKHPEN